MGQIPPDIDPFNLQDQLRALGNEELLDFWEESQWLDHYLDMEEDENPPSTYYEIAILNEPRIRTCNRSI